MTYVPKAGDLVSLINDDKCGIEPEFIRGARWRVLGVVHGSDHDLVGLLWKNRTLFTNADNVKFEGRSGQSPIQFTQLDTQEVWNALVGTDGWERIVRNHKCQGKERWCGMSLSWASRIKQDDLGLEQYRCPDCSHITSFKVPFGANR